MQIQNGYFLYSVDGIDQELEFAVESEIEDKYVKILPQATASENRMQLKINVIPKKEIVVRDNTALYSIYISGRRQSFQQWISVVGRNPANMR